MSSFQQWFQRFFSNYLCDTDKLGRCVEILLANEIRPGQLPMSRMIWGWINTGYIDPDVFHELSFLYNNNHSGLLEEFNRRKEVEDAVLPDIELHNADLREMDGDVASAFQRERNELKAENNRLIRALSYALHAFRARLSTHANDQGLARGELACLIGLGEELKHVHMGHLPLDVEQQVRATLDGVSHEQFETRS